MALYNWIVVAAHPKTALNYIEQIEAFCQGMSTGSERGTRRDDIRPGLRIVTFKKRVTIAFDVEETRVVILRLFYAGRNWEELIE